MSAALQALKTLVADIESIGTNTHLIAYQDAKRVIEQIERDQAAQADTQTRLRVVTLKPDAAVEPPPEPGADSKSTEWIEARRSIIEMDSHSMRCQIEIYLHDFSDQCFDFIDQLMKQRLDLIAQRDAKSRGDA